MISYQRSIAKPGWRKQQCEQPDLLHGNVWRAYAGDELGWKHVYVRPGNVERNQFFGPGYHVVNFGLFKDFPITERVKFQLRAQAYNVFNTPQFTNPDGDIHDGLAQPNGTYTTGTAICFGSISAVRQQSERQLEFAARINF